MGRRTRVALFAVSLVVAALLALYGLFAIAYTGDRESSATYVLVAGHRIDADVVGAARFSLRWRHLLRRPCSCAIERLLALDDLVHPEHLWGTPFRDRAIREFAVKHPEQAAV